MKSGIMTEGLDYYSIGGYGGCWVCVPTGE